MIDLWPRIETQRAVLRKMENTDEEFVYEHFQDNDVCEYLVDAEPVRTRKEAQEIIRWSHGDPQNPTNNRWIIIWRENSEAIGTCGFHRWDTNNNMAEIGYDLQKAFWGQGIMIEVLCAAIHFGFSSMKLNRIEAFVCLGNHRSYRLLQKIGFHLEGIVRDKHYFRGDYYDHYCFSLVRSDVSVGENDPTVKTNIWGARATKQEGTD